MFVFIIGIILVVLGLLAVAWLMLTDNGKKISLDSAASPALTKEKLLMTSELLKNIGASPFSLPKTGKKITLMNHLCRIFSVKPKKPPTPAAKPSAEKISAELTAISQIAQLPTPVTQGTAALRIDTASPDAAPVEDQLQIKKTELEKQLAQLEEKSNKLNTLLGEKNQELENMGQQLDTELKNRKEFNKVKDILEKELKDSKERNRSLEIELTSARTEADSYLKRAAQLEEKLGKIESDAAQKATATDSATAQLEKENWRIAAIEETLRKADLQIQDKDSKIALLVQRIKDTLHGSETIPKKELPEQASEARQITLPEDREEAHIAEITNLPDNELDDIQKMQQLASQLTQIKKETILPITDSPDNRDKDEPITPHTQMTPITAKDILKSIEESDGTKDLRLSHDQTQLPTTQDNKPKNSPANSEAHLAPDIFEETLKENFAKPQETTENPKNPPEEKRPKDLEKGA